MSPDYLLSLAAPLIIAGLGGLLSEWAGVLNIGLEGFMLGGAFAAAAVAMLGLPPALTLPVAVSAALATGGVFGWILARVSVRLKADIFVAALAVNILMASLVPMAGTLLFKTRSVLRLPQEALPSPAAMAAFGIVLPLGLALALAWFARHTAAGWRLRVLGEEPAMLAARGIAVDGLRFRAVLASALFASLAGALLPLGLGSFVPNQSGGLGWIALVLVFVGGRTPFGVVAACVGYAVLTGLSLAAQGGQEHPALLVGLPYLLVLAALVAVETLRRLSRRRQALR